jgi:hypothetical protein
LKKKNKKKKDKKKLKKWRSEGKQVIMYLDDGLGIEQNDEPCKAVVNQVKCDLIIFFIFFFQTSLASLVNK